MPAVARARSTRPPRVSVAMRPNINASLCGSLLSIAATPATRRRGVHVNATQARKTRAMAEQRGAVRSQRRDAEELGRGHRRGGLEVQNSPELRAHRTPILQSESSGLGDPRLQSGRANRARQALDEAPVGLAVVRRP